MSLFNVKLLYSHRFILDHDKFTVKDWPKIENGKKTIKIIVRKFWERISMQEMNKDGGIIVQKKDRLG